MLAGFTPVLTIAMTSLLVVGFLKARLVAVLLMAAVVTMLPPLLGLYQWAESQERLR